MAAPVDQWMKEYGKAGDLYKEIGNMMSERSSVPGPEAQPHVSAMRRKITILCTKLDSLQSHLSSLPSL